MPDLATMDDAIVNGTLARPPGAPAPLALFRAARVDYSLHRLYHYTGTDPDYFQNFVIFTNYQFYVDAFARICRERLAVAGGRAASPSSSPAMSSPGLATPPRSERRPSAGRRCRPSIWSSPTTAASP